MKEFGIVLSLINNCTFQHYLCEKSRHESDGFIVNSS